MYLPESPCILDFPALVVVPWGPSSFAEKLGRGDQFKLRGDIYRI